MRPRPLTGPDDPRHGTFNGYSNLGCRCRPCREANRAKHADYLAANPEQVEKHRKRQRDRMRRKRAELREAA